MPNPTIPARRTARTWLLAIALAGTGLACGPAAAQKRFDQPPRMDSAPRGRAQTANTRFTLINDSAQNIDNLNISPASDDSWGEDLMGVLALPPQGKVIAGPKQETGCTFDVRVVYHDQREEVLRRQNLCELEELSFTGKGARRTRGRAQSDD